MACVSTLLVLAAQSTALDDLKKVPKQFWINLLICVVALVIIVRIWKAMKNINEFLPFIAGGIMSFLILFYWVYERTEPAFLTPVVEKLTFFMPTKTHQQHLIEKAKNNRER